MDFSPDLSVIIPAYNVKAFIRQAVDSALRQSWRELEVIVIDDGSTDGTLEALDLVDDHRLRRIRQAHAGLAAARNAGIRAARGAYLGFLDGDDLWTPTKAERHLRCFRDHPELDLTFSSYLLIDELGKEIGPSEPRRSGVLSFQDLLVECPNCNAIVRRESIECEGLFDTTLVASEDLDMWLRIAIHGRKNIYIIPEILSFYRRRKGQLTEDWLRMSEAWEQLLEKFSRLAPEETRRGERRARQGRYLYYSFLAYEKGRYWKGIGFLKASIQCAPWGGLVNGRTWSLLAACLSGSLLPPAVHRSLKARVSWWRRRRRETALPNG